MIIAGLEICIFQEVKRVHFVMHYMQMHRTHIVRNAQRSFIGLDVILPEAQPGKDVRWHMNGVRRRRRDAGILARRCQSQACHLRIVAGVNNVVRNAGMAGVLLKKLVENSHGLSVIGLRWILFRP